MKTKRKKADESLIGRQIRKFFVGSGWFWGTIMFIDTVIAGFEKEEEMYVVRYHDGDQEDMTLAEVEKHLVPPRSRHGSRMFDYVSNLNDDEEEDVPKQPATMNAAAQNRVVRYQDGDQEDMAQAEVEEYLVPLRSIHGARMFDYGSNLNDDEEEDVPKQPATMNAAAQNRVVRYQDGDQEDMTLAEVEKHLVSPRSRHGSRMFDYVSNLNDDDDDDDVPKQPATMNAAAQNRVVRYQDGDQEDMAQAEVEEYLVPLRSIHGARMFDYGSNLNDDDDEDVPKVPATMNAAAQSPETTFQKQSLKRKPLEYQHFKLLWKMAEEYILQRSAEAVEAEHQFRRANRYIDPADTVHQSSAQYGRIKFMASKILLEALKCEKIDTFLDIGHGLANVVLQAAHVIGCASRGIEVVRVRYEESKRFELALGNVVKMARELHCNVDYGAIGTVDLICGRLEDPHYVDFLTVPAGQGAMKVFFNNFGSVFSERSAKHGHKHYLDDYVAGLFCSMPEGSILISCNRLNMPSTRSNILRQRPDAHESGFYEYETVDLGPANSAVSWAGGSNVHRIVGHKYTRVGPAYYICGKCGQRTEAYQKVNGGQRVPKICCLDNIAGLRPRKKPKICDDFGNLFG